MFIRNAWYIASWSDDLTEKPLARRICGEPLVLYRDAGAHAAALLDQCCHRSAPLSLGRVTGRGIECGYHGLVFDRGGACVSIPGQEHIPSKAKVRSYPVVEKDAFVWVWIGEEAADPALLVDYPFHNDTKNWPSRHTTMHIAGGYTLMVDNLMDLTHLGYVHTSTIGGNPLAHVEAKMVTEPKPTGLKFTRWMLDSKPPPTYCKAVPFTGNVDRWQEFEYVAPGSVLQWSGAVNANTGAYDQGKRDGGFSLRIFHGLTPETETSCFYFWSASNGYRQDDPHATEQLFQQIAEAFAEDKIFVEQQQARLTELGEGSLVDIKTDAARLSMRRTIDRLTGDRLTGDRLTGDHGRVALSA